MNLKIDTQTQWFSTFLKKTSHIIFHKMLAAYQLLSLVDMLNSMMLQNI